MRICWHWGETEPVASVCHCSVSSGSAHRAVTHEDETPHRCQRWVLTELSMFGGLMNLPGLLKQAKSMQENMQKMQEELAQQRHESEAGAGMVRAIVDGKGELVQVKIDPQAASDVEMLETLVVSAVSAASRKAQEAMKAEMAKMTGGFNLPGLT